MLDPVVLRILPYHALRWHQTSISLILRHCPDQHVIVFLTRVIYAGSRRPSYPSLPRVALASN
jgi:hypothetical protein